MKKEELLNLIDNRNFVEKFLKENFKLSFNEELEVLNILFEMQQSKNINIEKFLKEVIINDKKNKNEKTEEFIKYIRNIRNPMINNTFKKLKENINKIKDKKIKISYPQNLEGEEIKIEITLKRPEEVLEVLEKMNKGKENLIEICRIIKEGS